MYTGADQSWRTLPRFMSPQVYERAFERIAVYSREQGLRQASLVLHGGEPLMLGAERLNRFLSRAVDILEDSNLHAHFALQTNATLVTPEICHVLRTYDVEVGVSIDTTPESHDEARLDMAGLPTYDQVFANLQQLAASLETLPTVISVADFRVDPGQVIAHLEQLPIAFADVLLPDANWDDPMPDLSLVAKWWTGLFDAYLDSASALRIRTFQKILSLLQGAAWGSDAWGIRSTGTLILETDGNYHYHDVLRRGSEGAGDSGCNVAGTSVHEVAQHVLTRTMTTKEAFLSSACHSCPHRFVCGGGHIAHRYSSDRGFDNPSVYCEAIKVLVQHMTQRVGLPLGAEAASHV